MMHIGAENARARVSSVEAVSLGEKMFERSRARLIDFRSRLVGRGKARRFRFGPLARVFDCGAICATTHARAEVREMKETPRRPDCERVGRIEAEKPDSRFPIALDIEP